MRPIPAALIAILACGAAAQAGAAGRAERHRAEIEAGLPDGKPQSCIPIISIRETRVLSDRVIDFHMRDNKVYRSTLPNGCPELGFEESFSYETSLTQLCSTDIITVLRHSPVTRGASCGLGEFQPITGVRR